MSQPARAGTLNFQALPGRPAATDGAPGLISIETIRMSEEIGNNLELPNPKPEPESVPAIPTPIPPILERALLAYENPAFLNSADGRLIRILAEYTEPMARFRRERVQDTVVFFGSARFNGREEADRALELLANTGSVTPAPKHEQPASIPDIADGTASELGRRRAVAAVEMARYYEDARRLAHMITTWAMNLKGEDNCNPDLHRFVITSGGGPGIMEAANRGAHEAGGKTIGLNIRLPFEQRPNQYITPELNFEFHYFFMRKLWFAYLAKALVVFPGGFGTIDEMFEVLTLVQTHKLAKNITVVIYGSEYWKKVFNFEWLVDTGAISPGDVDLFQFADTPEEAFQMVKEGLMTHHLVSKARVHGADTDPQDQPGIELMQGPEFAKTTA
jgi:uncharacterized protein (TIGR00730 family)